MKHTSVLRFYLGIWIDHITWTVAEWCGIKMWIHFQIILSNEMAIWMTTLDIILCHKPLRLSNQNLLIFSFIAEMPSHGIFEDTFVIFYSMIWLWLYWIPLNFVLNNISVSMETSMFCPFVLSNQYLCPSVGTEIRNVYSNKWQCLESWTKHIELRT